MGFSLAAYLAAGFPAGAYLAYSVGAYFPLVGAFDILLIFYYYSKIDLNLFCPNKADNFKIFNSMNQGKRKTQLEEL